MSPAAATNSRCRQTREGPRGDTSGDSNGEHNNSTREDTFDIDMPGAGNVLRAQNCMGHARITRVNSN